MSFFDDASLVMIPSGYKTSKVYSVKPTDGTGDLTFSRNSGATRVGPNGLIEKVRTNLCLQSQTIDNATSWSNTLDTGATLTVTANYAAAPDGTTTADRIQMALNGSSYAQRNQSITLSAGGEYTYSIYLKSLSGTPTIIFFYDNVNNKTATLTNDWVRYTWTFTSTGNVLPRFVLEAGTSTSADFLAWGCQLETGVATDYIATTSAAVSVGPTANVPRLDYLGSTCPRLLLEPQRTNLVPMSEQMDNATFWNSAGGSLTINANVAISPDGYQNADGITLSNAANRYFVSAPIALTAGVVYTYSVYMKSTSGNLNVFMSGVNGLTGQMKTVTTDWQRFTLTFTMHGNGSEYFGFDQRAAGASTSGTVLFWGAQVEAGAYATSYIPTLGATVTRGADAASKTGISSLIGQTEGTLFGEFTFTGISPTMHLFSSVAGSFGNAIYVQTFSADGISMQVWTGVANQVAINKSGLTVGQNVKFAAAYKNNDFVLYVNGVQAGTDTSGTVPSGLSQLEVGGYAEAGSPFNFNSPIKQAIVFPVRLSNSDLAALTA